MPSNFNVVKPESVVNDGRIFLDFTKGYDETKINVFIGPRMCGKSFSAKAVDGCEYEYCIYDNKHYLRAHTTALYNIDASPIFLPAGCVITFLNDFAYIDFLMRIKLQQTPYPELDSALMWLDRAEMKNDEWMETSCYMCIKNAIETIEQLREHEIAYAVIDAVKEVITAWANG